MPFFKQFIRTIIHRTVISLRINLFDWPDCVSYINGFYNINLQDVCHICVPKVYCTCIEIIMGNFL